MGAHRYRLPLALAAAAAAAAAATLLLRPRGGSFDPAVVDATAYFSRAQLERAAEFRGPQRLIGLAEVALAGGLLALLSLRPPARLSRALGGGERRPHVAAMAIGAALPVAVVVVTLPLDAVAHERAVGVGLSTQPLPAWLLDLAKGTALSAAGGAAGAVVLTALVRRFPNGWWAPASVLAVTAAAALTYASPLLIEPLFNRFEPLAPGELRSSVLALADRTGVDVGEIYRVDASRRTTAVNAYVGGLGPTKRVVLYDTLIESTPPGQVRAVVAHELAHVRGRDVPRGLVWLAIAAPAGFLLVQRLAERLGGRGRTVAMPGFLLPVALALAVVGFLAQIPAAALSRMVERAADQRALEATGDPRSFIALQRELALRNVSEPDPPALYQDLFGSHPTTLQRIGLGVAFEARAAGAGAPAR